MFKEVNISAQLHGDKRLKGDAKILLASMQAEGMHPEDADINYLAYLYGVGSETIKNWIGAAVRAGYWPGAKAYKNRGTREAKFTVEPVFPDWATGEVKDEIRAFYAHRAAVKHPVLSEQTANRIVSSLTKLSDRDPAKAIRIIRQSIDSGKWWGLYPLREDDDKEYWDV